MSNKALHLVVNMRPLGETSNRSSNGKSRSSNGTTKRFLLTILADMADDAGYCWPGSDEMARRCEIGRSTVFKALKELEEEHGLISRAHRRKADGSLSSNAYRINLGRLREYQRPTAEAEADEQAHPAAALFEDKGHDPAED